MASRCLCPFGQKHLFYFIPLAHYFYFYFVYTVTIADKTDKRRIKLRTLGINEIEDIALGASRLGAGGGGVPYVGTVMAMGAMKTCGEVSMPEPEEIAGDEEVI